jgi:hypothetical protein
MIGEIMPGPPGVSDLMSFSVGGRKYGNEDDVCLCL